MNTPTYPLGHLALRVSDLARTRAFYVDTLHFPVIVEAPGGFLVNVQGLAIAFAGDDEHTPSGDRFDPFRVGLDHLALNVPQVEDLQQLLEMLNQNNIPNNGIEDDPMTHARYISFYDPDGIAWEFYVMPGRG